MWTSYNKHQQSNKMAYWLRGYLKDQDNSNQLTWNSAVICICTMHLTMKFILLMYEYLYISSLEDLFLVLICAIAFESLHTCVSIQNTNGHEVLSDSHK